MMKNGHKVANQVQLYGNKLTYMSNAVILLRFTYY